MTVPSLDIKNMIEDALLDSSGAAERFPISRGMLDASLPNCAAIVDVPGGKPQLTMDNAKYEFLSVQIKVMSSDYDEGWEFMSSVVDILHGRANETYNGAYYSLIECLNGPGFLERQDQRSIFIANFTIQRREL